MAASSRFPAPFFQPVSGAGVPFPRATLQFYLANTTTPQDTYTTAALAVTNANPVVADGNGRFPPIFLGNGITYDIVFADEDGGNTWTIEDVAAPSTTNASTTTAGVVELATDAEGLLGTDTGRVPPVSTVVQMILQGYNYSAAGGTANALTGSPTISPVALASGQEVYVRATSTNTAATTLNWASTGVVAVKVPGGAGATACAGGEIVTGNLYRFVYSGADSAWIVEPVGFAIHALTEDTNPDGAADFFVMRDTSAGLDKKVKPSSLAATQAQAAAATDPGRTLTPLNAKWHPGVAKVVCGFTVSGGTPSAPVGTGMTSITDNGVGDYTLNFSVTFSAITYTPVAWCRSSVAAALLGISADPGDTQSTTALQIQARRGTDAAADPEAIGVAIFGVLA